MWSIGCRAKMLEPTSMVVYCEKLTNSMSACNMPITLPLPNGDILVIVINMQDFGVTPFAKKKMLAKSDVYTFLGCILEK